MRGRGWGTAAAVIALVAAFALGTTLILQAEARAASGPRAVAVPETTPPDTPTSAGPAVVAPDLPTPQAADPSGAPPTPSVGGRPAAPSPRARSSAAPARSAGSTARPATPTPGASASPVSGSSVTTSRFTVPPATGEPTSTGSAAQVADAVDAAVADAAEDGVQEHVVVADRATGTVLAADGADAAVPSMSVAKLFVAADALELDGGPDRMAADDLQRLRDMIVYSDDGIMQDYYDADGDDAIIDRTVERYGLQDTAPTPDPQYWGDIQISARDLADFLRQALASPVTGPFLESAMTSAADTAADGFDQDFGLNAIAGAGSKQGWGCCLGGVDAIHSVGFTANRIVVVLSTSTPDEAPDQLGTADQLADDGVTRAALRAVTATARAAVDPSG